MLLLALLAAGFIATDLAAEPTAPASTPQKITVAVYPIKVLAVEKSYESLGPILTSFLVTKLSRSAKLKVTEQEMTSEVEKQLEFANSDKCDATMCPIPEIGKSIAAQKLVVGQVAKLGQKYTADIRVIDIEKKVIDFSVEEQLVCKEEDLDQLMDLAALDLREKFGEKVERPNTPAQPQSNPAPAQAPSYTADPLDSQNLLGITVTGVSSAERRTYSGGVKVKSVAPDGPCKDSLKPGNIITGINPNGSMLANPVNGKYFIADLAEFRKRAASLTPGASVGIWMFPGHSEMEVAHRVNCVLPSSPQTNPQTPAPTAPPAAPEEKAKKAKE